MSDPLRELSEQYASALQNYLKTEGEQALHHAYELGRRPITDGLGVLDIAKIHQQASIALL
ncbi:MAG: histidine kinase, partial [Verrucomicrobia bacterium]